MTTNRTNSKGILVIVGPTASGKTALAHKFAMEYGGEIINADSRQVYKFLDIGTAKPTIIQQQQIHYHLLDMVDPNDIFTLGAFLKQATDAIQSIRNRNSLPIVVGGTGQYIHALVNGWTPPQVSPNSDLRDELNALGIQELHARLKAVDPISADRIHPNNTRRIVRALEVYYTLNEPFSSFQQPVHTDETFVTIGIEVDKKTLNRNIDDRIQEMLSLGWESEIERILDAGYTASCPGFASLGYRTLAEVVQGSLPRQTALESIQLQTRQLARRQKQWFNQRRLQIMSTTVDAIDMKSLYNMLTDDCNRTCN